MAVASLKGSPGVTTTTVALGAAWHGATGRQAVIVEADPSGGDLAYVATTADRRPLSGDPNLVTLAADVRQHVQRDDRARQMVIGHAQHLACGVPAVVGVSVRTQVRGLAPLWPALAAALPRSSADVVVDVGRLDPAGPSLLLARSADVVVLVLTTSMASVLHARNNLADVAASLRLPNGESTRPGSASGRMGVTVQPVVVGPARMMSQNLSEIDALLAGTGAPVRPSRGLVEDRRAVATLLSSSPTRASRTMMRDASRLAVALADGLPPLPGQADAPLRPGVVAREVTA